MPKEDPAKRGTLWRSSLLLCCIIVGIVMYLETEYEYPSQGRVSEVVPVFSSSASLRLSEQIKVLEEKVDTLQKRYV